MSFMPDEILDIDTDLAFSEDWEDGTEEANADPMVNGENIAAVPSQAEADVTAEMSQTDKANSTFTPIINTYNERTLHATLKKQYEPDSAYHEVPYLGYIADIKRGDRIIEIQTGNFRHMPDKLAAFLQDNKVTVVYPLTERKWIRVLDPESGTFSQKRRSPRTGKIYHAFEELYQIRDFLSHPDLTVIVQMMDVEEYRKKNVKYNGRKRKSLRCETVPVVYGERYVLDGAKDYLSLLPELSEPFSAKMLAQVLKIDQYYAYSIIHCYEAAGFVRQAGSIGRAKAYEVVK